jgi:hypothetical protein
VIATGAPIPGSPTVRRSLNRLGPVVPNYIRILLFRSDDCELPPFGPLTPEQWTLLRREKYQFWS